MDTSIDHVSPTFDFILGRGVNFPVPTDEDFAHLLFSVLDELNHRCVLADIIGNRTQEHSGNYILEQALKEASRKTNKYPAKIRAKELYRTSRTDMSSNERIVIQSYVYIACTRMDAYWLLVEKAEMKHQVNPPYSFTQLDVSSMTTFFSHYRQYADHVGMQILRELTYIMNHRSSEWKEKQQRLEKAIELVRSTSERTTSACMQPHIAGTGIEG